MSSTHTIESNDIYHGLPTFDEQGLTAIVTGANGVSGSYMLKVLSAHPQRWKKIYALSRRPPFGDLPSNVEHVPLDFLKSPDQISATLKEKGEIVLEFESQNSRKSFRPRMLLPQTGNSEYHR